MMPLDWYYKIKIGKVIDVDITRNVALVRFSDVPGDEYEVTAGHPAANVGDGSSEDVTQRHSAWGVWSYPSPNSVVLVYHIQSQIPFVIATIPPKYGYEKWSNENTLNMNRIPIAAVDQRETDNDRKLSEDLLKWGEIFMRSVGLGDIMIDYVGNIILDTSRQVSIRIGPRDGNNKITAPEVEVSFGNILKTNGVDKTYDGQAIKAEIVYGSAFIRILENGQVNVNGHLTVDT